MTHEDQLRGERARRRGRQPEIVVVLVLLAALGAIEITCDLVEKHLSSVRCVPSDGGDE